MARFAERLTLGAILVLFVLAGMLVWAVMFFRDVL
jgi:hypothetical protein